VVTSASTGNGFNFSFEFWSISFVPDKRRIPHFKFYSPNIFSRRDSASAVWKRFDLVAKQIYQKGPYSPKTLEAKLLLEVREHLSRVPNPFFGYSSLADQTARLSELNVILHNSEELQKVFIEHVFSPSLIPLTTQLCRLPFCCSPTCQENKIGFENFKAEFSEYREIEDAESSENVSTRGM
jgi:hypothetical protein